MTLTTVNRRHGVGGRRDPAPDRVDAHLRTVLADAGVRSGRVLEIGGRGHPRRHVFGPGFTYRSLDSEHSDAATVAGDITHCPQILDGYYDVVLSVDVFEHVDRPWLAAAEISRILAPGGLAYTSTRFGWRYHPCPTDHWRYTPEALAFLFDGLTTIDNGFDLTTGRRDVRSTAWPDAAMLDASGGWRENVRVFHAACKPA